MVSKTVKSQRVDKWLWHARVVKTRTLAQKLVTGGKVRINKEKLTGASHKLCIGNVLTVTLPREVKVLEVLGFSERRGSYSQACLLYKDQSPPAPTRKDPTNVSDAAKIVVEGRPNQRDRRLAIDLKQNSS